MKFNPQNRSRRFARGRLMGYTTSPFIGYMDNNNNEVYPLFVAPRELVEGEVIAFCIEVNGFLVIDFGTEITWLETDAYERFMSLTTCFSILTIAAPPPLPEPIWMISGPNTNTIAFEPDGVSIRLTVNCYDSVPGSNRLKTLSVGYPGNLSFQDIYRAWPEGAELLSWADKMTAEGWTIFN